MQVVACADIHGNHDVYDWLGRVATARHADALVLAGDLFGFPDGYPTVETAQMAEGERAGNTLAVSGIPVFYVMGNDDWIEWAPHHSSIQSIHGRRVEFAGLNFVGYEYTPPFVGSIHEKPETEIRRDLDKLGQLVDHRTVLVTHGPARRCLDHTAAGEWVGSCAISDFLEKREIRAHIHGHVHRAFGRHGIHFNVAAAANCRAILIDLETMHHEILNG